MNNSYYWKTVASYVTWFCRYIGSHDDIRVPRMAITNKRSNIESVCCSTLPTELRIFHSKTAKTISFMCLCGQKYNSFGSFKNVHGACLFGCHGDGAAVIMCKLQREKQVIAPMA